MPALINQQLIKPSDAESPGFYIQMYSSGNSARIWTHRNEINKPDFLFVKVGAKSGTLHEIIAKKGVKVFLEEPGNDVTEKYHHLKPQN